VLLFRADGTAVETDSFVVGAGEMVGFEFDYRLSVSDEGLPIDPATIGSGGFWGPPGIVVRIPGSRAQPVIRLPLPDSREIGYANLATVPSCLPNCPPWLTFSGPQVHINTLPDDVPQSIAVSGHARFGAGLSPGFGFDSLTVSLPGLLQDTLALSAPIPEPATYALMLAGLSMVGLLARRRGEH
jgi:hypothetical protein